MWKKLSEWLQNSPKHEDESQKTNRVLAAAVAEIVSAISKNQSLLDNLRITQQELHRKLELAKTEKATAEYDLTIALKNNDKFQTNLLLAKKANAETSLKEIEVLYINLLKTVQQIEQQIRHLQAQKTELLTKQVVLTSKLQSANNQKELEKILTNLKIEQELEAADEKVLLAEVELEISDTYLSIDAQIRKMETGSNDQTFEAKFLREKQALQQTNDNAKQKKIDQMLAAFPTKNNTNELINRKQELFSKFVAQKNTNTQDKKKHQEDWLKDFFNPKPEDKTPPNSKDDFIKNFFDTP